MTEQLVVIGIYVLGFILGYNCCKDIYKTRNQNILLKVQEIKKELTKVFENGSKKDST